MNQRTERERDPAPLLSLVEEAHSQMESAAPSEHLAIALTLARDLTLTAVTEAFKAVRDRLEDEQ